MDIAISTGVYIRVWNSQSCCCCTRAALNLRLPAHLCALNPFAPPFSCPFIDLILSAAVTHRYVAIDHLSQYRFLLVVHPVLLCITFLLISCLPPTYEQIPKMRTANQLFSPLLCCFGVRSHDEHHAASDLRSLQQPASTLSVALPSSTVPHALGRSDSASADADALRQIFRSSSSVRGYRTASRATEVSIPRQSSFDADLKLGANETSHRKQKSRIEQLGNHIRQKLSESRLSRSGSKAHMQSEDAACEMPLPKQMLAPLGMEYAAAGQSQRSTGLLELLMSRSGSDGGYDSDARSIQTAMLTNTDGILKFNPRPAMALLRSSTEHTLSRDELIQVEPNPDTVVDRSPVPNAAAPHSSPSPPRTSPTQILRDERNESPTALLLKLNNGVANGVIEIPRTPSFAGTLTPTRSGSKATHDSNGSPSRSQKRRHRNNEDVCDALKTLSDTVAAAKRGSLVSTRAESPRASLLSDLDPGLIDFISGHGKRSSMETSKSFRLKDVNRADNLNSTGEIGHASHKASVHDKEEASSKDFASLSDSDRSSVHLYNMRISQRLASASFGATTSRPTTSHTTAQHSNKNSMDACLATSQTSTNGRLPGSVAAEHNRLPSDPETRRLFENNENLARPCSHRSPISSDKTFQSKRPNSIVSHGQASSFYWSDGEAEYDETLRPSKSRGNPNSIAIGGRSESNNLPGGSSNVSMSQISIAEESAWFSRRPSQRRRKSEDHGRHDDMPRQDRSVSLPSRASQVAKGLAHPPGKNQESSTARVHEASSENSDGHLSIVQDEELKRIGTRAVGDEGVSETVPEKFRCVVRAEQEAGNRRPLFWSRQRQLSTASDIPPDEKSHDLKNDGSSRQDSMSIRPLQESTTDMWRRTLKRAIEDSQEESLGGFLTAPRFNRDGRRRSTRSSVSTVGSNNYDTERQTTVPTNRNDNVHVERQERLGIEPPAGVRSQRLGLPPTISPRPSITIVPTKPDSAKIIDEKKRKKSLRDIGRRFTLTATSAEDGRGSGASTPLRDLIGIWGRFPSHTRSERCGATGPADNVTVRDFAADDPDENTTLYLSPWSRSMTGLRMRTPESRRVLSFGRKSRMERAKSRSMSLPRDVDQSLELRARKSRKGLVGRWKRFYRSSSSDIRAFVHTYGHRSSISVGANVEYPELEVIPGVGGFDDQDFVVWSSDLEDDTDANGRHHREEATQSSDGLQPTESPSDTQPWTQMYKDCVGSLSALKSDEDVRSMNIEEEMSPGLDEKDGLRHMTTSELRSSTASFGVQLGKELEAVREGLMRKINRTTGQDNSAGEEKIKKD